MDVQLGHCWRCEKILPNHFVQCNNCPLAKYCSSSCQGKDKVRHSSVECQIYGPKNCSNCGKTGITKECSQCNYAWYCCKECQQSHWKIHKKSCLEVKANVKSLAAWFANSNSPLSYAERVGDPPHYIGNVIAKDFLQLDNNELSNMTQGDSKQPGLDIDYHVLSAGCGDLRNTVLTAGSLPDRYQGKLHFTLDDFDPFVMARNVLFLYMLVRFADTEGIESILTTIWYSLHISKREYDLIKTSLDELIQMDAQSLHDATKGLVSVLDMDLGYLSQVWEKWKSLECQRDKKNSINLRQQRKALFSDMEIKEGVSIYLDRLLRKDKKLMEKWFDHGLFLPVDTKQTEMPFDNPTLTGREGLKCEPGSYNVIILNNKTQRMMPPTKFTFVYCIKENSFPFVAWDCLRVRECTSGSSPMVMYHRYVTDLLGKVKNLISQRRLSVFISLANCLDFPNHHQTLQMQNYDRIFTSNLADYVGFDKILKTLMPLLNSNNSCSVIVTETMNWIKLTPGADIQKVSVEKFQECMIAHVMDVPYRITTGYNDNREYFNNTPCFLVYLRAQIMGGGLGIPMLKEVPSFTAVMQYNGLKMRDFRKELNKLVPFQYRVNARDLTMMNGYDRTVEWYLP